MIMNTSLIKLYVSVLIGAFFPLGTILAPFLYYSLAKTNGFSEQIAEMQRHLRDIINFQIHLYVFMFIYMLVFWYLKISSYNESKYLDIAWMYLPVILFVILDILYPLFIIIHLKIGKPRKRYYYSLIRFF